MGSVRSSMASMEFCSDALELPRSVAEIRDSPVLSYHTPGMPECKGMKKLSSRHFHGVFRMGVVTSAKQFRCGLC